MQPPLQDPSFSLSSPHFKEGQWRSKGPAWPFRVTTRIGWEPSSSEGAPRCPQPWPAPSAPLLLGGPTLVTLDGCSPSSPHGTSPDRIPRSLKSTGIPQSTQVQGTLPAAHGTRLKPPKSLLPGASVPLPLRGESCFIIPCLL